MLEQTDFSESGWTGPGMLDPMMPSTPSQPYMPTPAPMGDEEDSMSSRKPRRAAPRKKKASRPKPKAKAKKKARPKAKAKAKAKRGKAKRKSSRGRRR